MVKPVPGVMTMLSSLTELLMTLKIIVKWFEDNFIIYDKGSIINSDAFDDDKYKLHTYTQQQRQCGQNQVWFDN